MYARLERVITMTFAVMGKEDSLDWRTLLRALPTLGFSEGVTWSPICAESFFVLDFFCNGYKGNQSCCIAL